VSRLWPAPIWMHLTFTVLVSAAFFFGGAFAAALLGAGGAAFIGGAVVGLIVGQVFMIYCVPARCPKCGGRTYYRGGTPITYHCRDCQHVHATSVSDRSGAWGGR